MEDPIWKVKTDQIDFRRSAREKARRRRVVFPAFDRSAYNAGLYMSHIFR